MNLSVLDGHTAAAPVRDTDADAGILHGTADSHIRVAVVDFFHRLQRLCKGCARRGDLTVGKFLTRPYGVAVADFPRGNPHHLCQEV